MSSQRIPGHLPDKQKTPLSFGEIQRMPTAEYVRRIVCACCVFCSSSSDCPRAFQSAEFFDPTVRRRKPVSNRVKVSYSKGVATHADPESCVCTGNCAGEALTGARAGQVLSRESKINFGGPTAS